MQKLVSFPYLTPLLLGLVAFWCFCDPNILNGSNIAWITGGDPAQQYLGWQFFRLGPWSLPLGMNPLFGDDLNASIIYSDSIPLLAFLLKPFSLLLPDQFQYLGIWLLICFLLQSVLSWKLLSLFTPNAWLLLLGACFFLSFPIFLARIGFHHNLSAHFLILSAFVLIFSKDEGHKKYWYWLVLIILSELINFYFFLMIACIWLGSSLDTLFSSGKGFNRKKLVLLFPIFMVCGLLVAWQAGYFVAGPSISQGQYGISRINVLSPFDAQGWSYFLSNIPGSYSSAESFSYLGSGAILLIIIASFLAIKLRMQLINLIAKHKFLLLTLLVFTLFAITNQFGIGLKHWHYPLPDIIIKIGSIARQSSRLFTPVAYFLILFAVVLVIRSLKPKMAIIILSICLLVQVVDTSAGWWPLKIEVSSRKVPVFDGALSNLMWSQFPNTFNRVLRVPAQQYYPNWETFATYASRHHMSTNSVYLARVDSRKLDAMNAKFDHSIITGQYDPQSLYIVDDEKILPVLMHLDTSKDVFARINGINVLAPGWRTCASCSPIPKEMEIHSVIPPVVLDQKIDFSSKGLGKYFLVGIGSWPISGWGWSFPEAFGTWSEGKQAKIVMPLPDGAKTLTLEMRALVSPNHPQQTVGVQIDGKLQQTAILTQDQGNFIEIALPPKTAEKDYVTIDLQFKNQAKPKNLALGDDVRELAIGLVSGVVR